MSKKDRAKLSRINGAKSNGPITGEGKAISSQNANKSNEYAQMLAQHAVLCNEDRQSFNDLLTELTQIYQPLNQLAAAIVRDIATARWQVERLNLCLTFQWNLAIADSAKVPSTVAPELAELETIARSANALYTSGAVAHRINRQIDQLELRIARFERRLKFVHANFPTAANQPAAPTETKTQINEPAVHIVENSPAVVNIYERRFPHSKIIVMPPDNVAKGIHTHSSPSARPSIPAQSPIPAILAG